MVIQPSSDSVSVVRNVSSGAVQPFLQGLLEKEGDSLMFFSCQSKIYFFNWKLQLKRMKMHEKLGNYALVQELRIQFGAFLILTHKNPDPFFCKLLLCGIYTTDQVDHRTHF